jgi:hypothetical protein
MSREKRLRRKIKQIRDRRPKRWKNAIWAWANRGEGTLRRKIRRFRAYRSYAADLERYIIKHQKPGEKRKDARREADKIRKAANEKLDHLEKRFRQRKREREDNDGPPPTGAGWVYVDGRQVCGWMAGWVQRIRAAGWDGTVVSGVRTPAYSEQLCYQMCGAPSCPGRCAGRASNHNATTCAYPQGALDVSDYVEFGYLARKLGAPFHNSLGPADPVHFSASGN